MMLDIASVGLLLILAGVAVLFIATFFHLKKGGAEAKGGGVVMVGPIPIVFGSDAKWASIAIVLAIILMVVSLLMYLA